VPAHFDHTMRSLERSENWVFWLFPALACCAAWLAWMVLARVDIYASSSTARIEVRGKVHHVASQAEGRIAALHYALGQRVHEGELLVELESTVERAQLDQELTELDSLLAKTSALRDQIAAEHAKREARELMGHVAAKQADFALRQARVSASHQRELTKIATDLHDRQVTARIDALAAGVALSGSRLRVGDAETGIDYLRASYDYEDKAVLAQIAGLQRDLTYLEAEGPIKRAAVERVRAQLQRRRITAPTTGSLGNIAALQVGDVVKAGDVIASVIPADDVHVIAEFQPDHSVGRIVPGQPARLRLNAFSWVEFGMLDATVAHVANEPHAGSIRVELVLASAQARIPVQHGLPGSIDIRVGSASPWELVLRSIGSRLTPDAAPSSAALVARRQGP
jgi:multidrug resistance efflux pump